MRLTIEDARVPAQPPFTGWPRVHGIVLGLLLAGIAGGCLAQLHTVLRDTLRNSVDLLFDDAYYYLGVAWNLGHGHGSKFAEPLVTNGYHPLWLGLLAVLTALFDLSKQGLVCTALTLTAAAKCLGIWLFERGQPDAWRRTFGRVALFLVIVKFPFVFSQALETTLFVVFIPWLLRLAKVRGWSPRHAAAVGVLMALVFLTRLDALALDLAVLAIALATRRAGVAAAALAALPLAVAGLLYVAINLHFFGTPLPLSGQAKAIGSQLGANLATSLGYFGSLRWAAVMLLVAAAARLTLAWRPPLAGFELACLACTLLACALYYGLLSGWPIWPWYLYPNAFLTVYAALAAATAAVAMLRAVLAGRSPQAAASIATAAVAVLAGGLAVQSAYQVVRDDDVVRPHLLATGFQRAAPQGGRRDSRHDKAIDKPLDSGGPAPSSFNQQNVALIPWLVERYPGGASIAMGDRAGGLGYYLPRQFALYQIEGLVADKAFLQTLRDGALEAFLAQRQLDLYIADRPRGLLVDGVMGFVEPVQPRVTGGPVNLLCFPSTAQLLAQDYRWGPDPQLRRVFDFNQRTACPPRLLAEVRALRARVDGVRSQAGL